MTTSLRGGSPPSADPREPWYARALDAVLHDNRVFLRAMALLAVPGAVLVVIALLVSEWKLLILCAAPALVIIVAKVAKRVRSRRTTDDDPSGSVPTPQHDEDGSGSASSRFPRRY